MSFWDWPSFQILDHCVLFGFWSLKHMDSWATIMLIYACQIYHVKIQEIDVILLMLKCDSLSKIHIKWSYCFVFFFNLKVLTLSQGSHIYYNWIFLSLNNVPYFIWYKAYCRKSFIQCVLQLEWLRKCLECFIEIK